MFKDIRDVFLRWVGERIAYHRTMDTEEDRRAEAVLWLGALIVAEMTSAEQAASSLADQAQCRRGLERSVWLSMTDYFKHFCS